MLELITDIAIREWRIAGQIWRRSHLHARVETGHPVDRFLRRPAAPEKIERLAVLVRAVRHERGVTDDVPCYRIGDRIERDEHAIEAHTAFLCGVEIRLAVLVVAVDRPAAEESIRTDLRFEAERARA